MAFKLLSRFWRRQPQMTSDERSAYKQPQDRTNDVESAKDGVFDNPWREVKWEKSEIVEEIMEFSLCNPQVKLLQLLITGPIGAGKSSFVTSVDSAFQNRVTNKAIMSTPSDTSCTTAYRGYKIKNGTSGTLTFILYDTMGLEIGKNRGVLPQDVKSALHGYLPDGYKFIPCRPLTSEDPGYISKPPIEAKTHCLICVLPGNTISQMSDDISDKMKKYIKEAADLGIPQVVIMTMIDEICPRVKMDLKNVYLSKKIKEKMQMCSDYLCIPMTCIFPVKNYHEETKTNDDMDVLLLFAMRQILHFANDFTEVL